MTTSSKYPGGATYIAGVSPLCPRADGGVRKNVGGAELGLESPVARVVAPEGDLDLLEDQGVLRRLRAAAPPRHVTLDAVVALV